MNNSGLLFSKKIRSPACKTYFAFLTQRQTPPSPRSAKKPTPKNTSAPPAKKARPSMPSASTSAMRRRNGRLPIGKKRSFPESPLSITRSDRPHTQKTASFNTEERCFGRAMIFYFGACENSDRGLITTNTFSKFPASFLPASFAFLPTLQFGIPCVQLR